MASQFVSNFSQTHAEAVILFFSGQFVVDTSKLLYCQGYVVPYPFLRDREFWFQGAVLFVVLS